MSTRQQTAHIQDIEQEKEPNLVQEISSKFPSILKGAFSPKNTNVLTSTGKFLILPFLNWKFLKLVFALIALYVLIQHDTQAQTYQQYPESPAYRAVVPAPLSPEDSSVVKKYSQKIISNSSITKGAGNIVVCDLFFEGSKIVHVSKYGSYWKVKAQFRTYTDLYFFKASKYDLSWIRVGMKTDKSERRKRYAQMIEANKVKLARYNDSIMEAYERENRSFISKIINP